LMPLLFLSVLKLLEVSCQLLFQKVHSSQPKRAKSSQPTKITNKLSPFKSLKVRDLWQKTITYWENSTWLVFQQLPEEFLKSKLLSKLMPMVSYKSAQLIRAQVSRTKLLSLTTKEDFLRKKLNKC
jgi:hypothetical protein